MGFRPISSPKKIPLKERISIFFVGRNHIDVVDGAFVAVDPIDRENIHIPIGNVACLMLEPGARLSHAAARLASQVGTLITWVGEGGVRFYSAGQPGGARADKLLYQAKLALSKDLRLKVARKMYSRRFGVEPPAKRSIDQLRGLEGNRVKDLYRMLARRHGIRWSGRKYDPRDWSKADEINRCLSVATSCLYGVTEAAILAAGYAPAIGFIHTGKPLSFVYDIADIIKFERVVPMAFEKAAEFKKRGRVDPLELERTVRLCCRDIFRSDKTLKNLIPMIEEILAAGEIDLPTPPKDSQFPALPDSDGVGDVGHRGA